MTLFASPREALRVYFAARRGPRAARPRWDGMPSARSYRSADDSKWVLVGQMLHAGCGVEIGSDEETAVRRWVEGLDERTWAVRKVEDRMRELLREVGWMPATRERVEHDEVDGKRWGRLVRAILGVGDG